MAQFVRQPVLKRTAVPTIRFDALHVFLVLAHDRRRILHFNATARPTEGVGGTAIAGGIPF